MAFLSKRAAYRKVRRATLPPLLLAFSCLFPLSVLAEPALLELKDGDQVRQIPINTLRDQASLVFTIYDPYQAQEVELRGIPFDEFLIEYFGKVPPRLYFMAWDDYMVELSGWDEPGWVLVTHSDGQPLTLRDRGPLRLVERDYGERDVLNLRAFNDWIWMIRSIEAKW